MGKAQTATIQTDMPIGLLTDDAAARLATASLSYRVHSTIGILIRSIRRQQRKKEEVLSILRNLTIRSSLFIRPSLLQEIIDKVENQELV